MPGRTFAIGDVHGCLAALNTLLEAIDPRPEDTIITLGDYVDRGPDSRGVLDRLIALKEQCRLIPLLGNHDQLLRDVCAGQNHFFDEWLAFGGQATVASYGGRVPEAVPPEHVAFLAGCVLFHETARHFFVHASYVPNLPLVEQPFNTLVWEPIRDRQPGPHYSGKVAIVGHTSQKDGEILDLGYLKCIDTCCYGEGWLTALEIESGQVWQVRKNGVMRRPGDPGPDS